MSLGIMLIALAATPGVPVMAAGQDSIMDASNRASHDRIGGEPVMLELYVNDVRRNEIIALIETADDTSTDTDSKTLSSLWVSARDFEALRIDVGELPRADIDGETYVLLTTSARLAIALDIDVLRLSLRFAPDLLGRRTIDLSTLSDFPPGPALPAHAWVDYDIDLRADREIWSASADIAANVALAGWTLRSEHAIAIGPKGAGTERLRSFAERDWPQAMVRVSLGELPPSRTPFGRIGPMTGLRIARRFDLRPGFGSAPAFAYDGTVDLPSTAEIYLDDALLRTVRINPGRYDLRNLTYFTGLRDVRVVVSDASGGRREILMPHYFSDGLLRRGIHEFEYTLSPAWPKTAESRGPALTAWHRYGISDRLTFGAGGEVTRNASAWSADFAAVLGRFGTLQGQYARTFDSRTEGEGASAMTLRYGFVVNAFSFSLSEWRMDPGFRQREESPSSIAPISPLLGLTSTNLSFALSRRQSLSLSAARERRDGAQGTTRLALRYTVRPIRRMSLGARFSRSRTARGGVNEAMISMQFDFGRGWSGGLEHERSSGRDRRAIAVERGSPQTGGWGLRARIEQDEGSARLETMVRRDFAFGEFGATLRHRQGVGGGAMLGLRFGGAVIAAGHRLHVARPVREGFALVDTGGLVGVRVYRNNTLVGRTDADGRLLLPGLGAYMRQQIRLDDRDVPIEVALDAIAVDAVPRSRIGIDVHFPSRRIVGAGGRLMFSAEGDLVPVASAVLSTTIDGAPVRTSTAPDGEFYFDGLAPGEFVLEARNASISCRATMRIDASAPAHTDLGEVVCAPVR